MCHKLREQSFSYSSCVHTKQLCSRVCVYTQISATFPKASQVYPTQAQMLPEEGILGVLLELTGSSEAQIKAALRLQTARTPRTQSNTRPALKYVFRALEAHTCSILHPWPWLHWVPDVCKERLLLSHAMTPTGQPEPTAAQSLRGRNELKPQRSHP